MSADSGQLEQRVRRLEELVTRLLRKLGNDEAAIGKVLQDLTRVRNQSG